MRILYVVLILIPSCWQIRNCLLEILTIASSTQGSLICCYCSCTSRYRTNVVTFLHQTRYTVPWRSIKDSIMLLSPMPLYTHMVKYPLLCCIEYHFHSWCCYTEIRGITFSKHTNITPCGPTKRNIKIIFGNTVYFCHMVLGLNYLRLSHNLMECIGFQWTYWTINP